MALTPGSRLGPYEIVSALGAGGMGEVYRATDTHLGRQVAIKVLPDAFAQDTERLARFVREAKTLAAALNHPHIAAIYGWEKSPAPAVAAARRRSHLRARASAAEGVSHQGALHIRQAYWSLTNS